MFEVSDGKVHMGKWKEVINLR